MSTDIRFPQGPIADQTTGLITLEWQQWFQNPQFLTVDISGVIGVSSGGTGLTSGTPGGVLAFIGATTLASSAALTANAPVLGGGVGVPTAMAAGTNGQIIVGQTSNVPLWKTMGGDATLSSAGNITVTKTGGASFAAIATTGSGANLSTNSVANAALAQMAANTVKGNNTAGVANVADLTVSQLIAMFPNHSQQVFTSGTAATYTTPAGCRAIYVRCQAPGGGGGGAKAAGSTSGGAAGDNIFNGVHATGGLGGTSSAGGGTGAASPSAGTGTANLRISGQPGGTGNGSGTTITFGGPGGNAFMGFGGQIVINGSIGSSVGGASGAGYGGAGGGETGDLASFGAAGGASAGEYFELLITSPSATYTYTVGAAGTAGTGTHGGAAGQPGIIIVDEFYV